MAHVSFPTADWTTLLGGPRRGLAASWQTLFRAAVLGADVRAAIKPTPPVGQNGGGSEAAASDVDDIRLARQGDSDAYRRLVERHQNQVARILWRFSRDRLVHEELVQDVFVEAYMSLGGYNGKAPFDHWLACIATRVGYR